MEVSNGSRTRVNYSQLPKYYFYSAMYINSTRIGMYILINIAVEFVLKTNVYMRIIYVFIIHDIYGNDQRSLVLF